MCEYYGLPLALIFEELIDMDKPEDKAQEQRPAEAEQEQQSKGTANNQPPPLCLQWIFSRRPLPSIALYAAFMRLVVLENTPASLNGLYGACMALRVYSAPSWYYRRRQGLLSEYIPAPSARLRPRKKRASEGVFFTRSIQGLFLCLFIC